MSPAAVRPGGLLRHAALVVLLCCSSASLAQTASEWVTQAGYEENRPVFKGDWEMFPRNTDIRPETIYLPRGDRRNAPPEGP